MTAECDFRLRTAVTYGAVLSVGRRDKGGFREADVGSDLLHRIGRRKRISDPDTGGIAPAGWLEKAEIR